MPGNKKLEQLWMNYKWLCEHQAPVEKISEAFSDYERAHREEWDKKKVRP